MEYNAHKYRPAKERMRNMFFGQIKRSSKNYLCLPGEYCEDVIHGMELGVINEKTKIWAIEQNPDLVPGIKARLRSLKLRHHVWNAPIEKTYYKTKFDLAYIDLCGQISEKLLMWLVKVHFTPISKIGFTFSYPARSRKITFYNELIRGEYDEAICPEKLTCRVRDDNPRLERLVAMIRFMRPQLRFNIAKTYYDSTPMVFLGGYFGKAPVYVPLGTKGSSKPKVPAIERVREKVNELAKNIEYGQQLGGLKISWNHLPTKDRRILKREMPKKLAKLGLK
jgi:hypothetical protein